MGFQYETQSTNTYLVYEIQPEEIVDTMSLGMLTNNKIAGLAATLYTQMDAERFIKFNVTAKIPASQILSGPVNRKRLIGVFKGITSALISADDYMIEPNSILLDLDYIYTDVSTFDTALICLPVQRNQNQVNLGQFFKEIMFSTQFDQTENCDYVAKTMNYLNSSPSFSVYDFDKLMDQLASEGCAQPASVNQMPQQPAAAQNLASAQPMQQPPAAQSQPTAQPVQQAPQSSPVVSQPKSPSWNYAPASAPSGGAAGAAATAAPQGFAIPNAAGQYSSAPTSGRSNSVQQPKTVPQGNAAQPKSGEKPMTYMNLLMHYNKENAALYKAQKAAKKNGAAAAAPEAKPSKKEKKAKSAPPAAFAIPGAQPAVPTPVSQPSLAHAGATLPPQNPASNGQRQAFAVPQGELRQQPQKPQPAQSYAPQPAQSYAPQPAQSYAPQPAQSYAPQPAQTSVPQGVQPSQGTGFGETTVLGGAGIGETTVLGGEQQSAQQIKPYLLRMKNNERINIDKQTFRIGKERSFVDYFVSDNSAVSRSHAIISARDGNYYITDTNSTNHTFVNGGIIRSNEEVYISHGTKIRLADEEFEFRLY